MVRQPAAELRLRELILCEFESSFGKRHQRSDVRSFVVGTWVLVFSEALVILHKEILAERYKDHLRKASSLS